MRYRHVIWDWNGTLLDDAWLCREIMNGMLAGRNLPTLTPERYQEVFDFPVIEYYRRVGFDFEKESFEKLGTEFIVEYERRRLECHLQDGAVALLDHLRDGGIEQSVLSAYRQDTLEELVDHFGLRDYFVMLVGLEDHYANGKTDSAKRLIEGIPHAAHDVLLVGDTTHDHEVARGIGADCLLIACGHHARRKLESCGVPVLTSLHDVRNIVTVTM